MPPFRNLMSAYLLLMSSTSDAFLWGSYVFEDDFYGGTLVIVSFLIDGQDVQNNVFIFFDILSKTTNKLEQNCE